MSTQTSLTILVAFLSTALLLFLVLGCVLLAKMIKISNDVKKITEHAEHIAGQAEAVSDIMGKAAAPMAFSKVLSNIVENVTRRKKG